MGSSMKTVEEILVEVKALAAEGEHIEAADVLAAWVGAKLALGDEEAVDELFEALHVDEIELHTAIAVVLYMKYLTTNHPGRLRRLLTMFVDNLVEHLANTGWNRERLEQLRKLLGI